LTRLTVFRNVEGNSNGSDQSKIHNPSDTLNDNFVPEAVVQRQLDAYNARDLEGILATYATDARQFEHPAKMLANGTAQLRERFAARFQEPNLHATLVKRMVMGNIVIDQEKVTRTFPDGTGVADLIAIYEVQDGRIANAWFIPGGKTLDAGAPEQAPGEKPPVLVRVTRRFAAPAGKVYDAWLQPEMLGRWMFGPGVRDEEIVHLSLDAHVGGAFSFLVRRQGKELDHVGRYLELQRSRRLVFTWGMINADSSRVSVDIVSSDIGCELLLTHELHPDWADFASRTEQGWTKMLGALAKALESA
jgi:uncharacterized protein YndB with AHSA1/START domain